MKLKDLLAARLSKKELLMVPSSYDIVGDIIIFNDFPEELSKKEKIIGETILKHHKNIKVIAKKIKKYSGKFRLPKLKVIAGEQRKETEHKENNVRLSLDVEKVYFSSRSSTERKRIFEQVKPGEEVLVMFSGCAPLAIEIAKNSQARLVYAVEINPIAHEYALKNIKNNKVEDKVKLFLGDVNDILPKLRKKFDRVLMPLPKGGEEFLGLAITKAKKGGIIHFYDFLNLVDFDQAKQKVKTACRNKKRKCRILTLAKCGQFSPKVFRVCIDAKIS